MKRILTLILVFLPVLLSAQDNYYLKNYTTLNGLPHNNVKCIVQDNTGFLWIATWDGLSRFDGYEFHNYYHKPDDSTSLAFFLIKKLCLDSLNNLWIYDNSGGLSLYNRNDDNFKQFNYRGDKTFKGQSVSDIAIDPNGTPWLAGGFGLKKLDHKTQKFLEVKLFTKTGTSVNLNKLFPLISFDNKGDLWLQFYAANKTKKILKCSLNNDPSQTLETAEVEVELSIKSKDSATNLPSNFIPSYNYYVSSTGRSWIFSNIGLFCLDTLKGIFKEYHDPIPVKELVGNKDITWSWYKGESIIFNSKANELIRLMPDPNETNETAFIDNNYTIWLGKMTESGEGRGLTRCIKTKLYFKHYLLPKNGNDTKVAVFSILKDKYNDLWVGVRNYNFILRLKPNGIILRCNVLSKEIWLDSDYPRSMIEDSIGIWMGYYSDLLARYNYRSNQFRIKLRNNKPNIDHNKPEMFRKLLLDEKGNLIIASDNVYIYDPLTERIKKLWDSNRSMIYSTLKAQNNHYWMGLGDSRLMYFDSVFNITADLSICRQVYSIEDICLGDSSDLWLALLGGGICHLEPKTEKKEFYTTSNGLSNNTTYKILKDRKGNLWISTNHGISQFNPKTRKFRIFSYEDGLKIDEFNADAAFLAKDGEMFFGGMGGLVSFYPDSFYARNEPALHAHLILIDFKVSGKIRFFSQALYESKKIILRKGDDNFETDFCCMDFNNADKLIYRYRLTGYNNSWVETDHMHRNVNYSNLSPGKYKFEIEATSQNGDWLRKSGLEIIIPSFFYQTILFKILILMVSGLIIGGFLIIYIRQIKLKEKEKQDKLILQSLRGQMNPHFIFNSLNSINYFIARNDRVSANSYIADFSRLIRSILFNMSSEYILLEKEIESIKDYLNLEYLRFGDKFEFQLSFDEKLAIDKFEVFPGLVQPFIENAIWHGIRALEDRKGFIQIEFSLESDNILQCIIKDDGIGRNLSTMRKNENDIKKSRGIEIVVERIKVINNLRKTKYKLKIEDVFPEKEETGTQVTIEIPFKRII